MEIQAGLQGIQEILSTSSVSDSDSDCADYILPEIPDIPEIPSSFTATHDAEPGGSGLVPYTVVEPMSQAPSVAYPPLGDAITALVQTVAGMSSSMQTLANSMRMMQEQQQI